MHSNLEYIILSTFTVFYILSSYISLFTNLYLFSFPSSFPSFPSSPHFPRTRFSNRSFLTLLSCLFSFFSSCIYCTYFLCSYISTAYIYYSYIFSFYFCSFNYIKSFSYTTLSLKQFKLYLWKIVNFSYLLRLQIGCIRESNINLNFLVRESGPVRRPLLPGLLLLDFPGFRASAA